MLRPNDRRRRWRLGGRLRNMLAEEENRILFRRRAFVYLKRVAAAKLVSFGRRNKPALCGPISSKTKAPLRHATTGIFAAQKMKRRRDEDEANERMGYKMRVSYSIRRLVGVGRSVLSFLVFTFAFSVSGQIELAKLPPKLANRLGRVHLAATVLFQYNTTQHNAIRS